MFENILLGRLKVYNIYFVLWRNVNVSVSTEWFFEQVDNLN